MACTLRVPNELQDHIIDFVAPDVSSLRSCALVCRTWHPRSATHLFSTMSVKTSGAFLALSTLVDRGCVWLAHTRNLRLLMPGTCTMIEIERILRCMPQLVELTFGACQWKLTTYGGANVPLPAVLPYLRTLRIEGASTETLRAMTGLLASQFPMLESVDMTGISVEDVPGAGMVLSQLGASLRTLRLGLSGYKGRAQDGVLQDHLCLSHLPRLETLRISDLTFHPGKPGTTSYAWIAPVLLQCAAATVVFELDFPPVVGMGVVMPRVSARVSERLLDWVPWARCAQHLQEDSEIVLDIWPRQVVKADLVFNAIKRRLPGTTKIRPVQ
ncbi:hypothetical protein AURDEDRAFT_186173 [Auricularia subglabra TFB-10046 SS5]|nr:hypothetical protein AURDEDRAFT_186173 [Auricularia subglabra TFB-10046 SS5]